jgi:hypothetical protein
MTTSASRPAAPGRAGFQRLVSEVSLDHVGSSGIEIHAWRVRARLASITEHALFRTLIADSMVYDPVSYNDRLLLGLKGTMSEAG